MFVTSQGHPGAQLQRALKAGNLIAAEQAAFEAPSSRWPRLVRWLSCMRRKGDRKFERAALKYLRRYMDEADPSLADVAQVTALLAERDLMMRGL